MKPMNEEKDHWVSSFCIGLKVFLYFGIQNDTLVSCNSFIACLSVMLHFTYHNIVFGDSNLPSRLEYQLLRQMNAKISMYTSFLPFLYVYGLKAFTQLPFYVYMLNCWEIRLKKKSQPAGEGPPPLLFIKKKSLSQPSQERPRTLAQWPPHTRTRPPMDRSLTHALRPLPPNEAPPSIGRFLTCVFTRGQRVNFSNQAWNLLPWGVEPRT